MLTFQNVEEVKGYVLITKTEKIKKINLSSLRLIKGGGDLIHKGTMVDCKKVEEERKKTALAVMDNADLEELLLPNLIGMYISSLTKTFKIKTKLLILNPNACPIFSFVVILLLKNNIFVKHVVVTVALVVL